MRELDAENDLLITTSQSDKQTPKNGKRHSLLIRYAKYTVGWKDKGF